MRVPQGAARKLEDALELADLAERLVRSRLRRQHPELSDAVVEERILSWLHDRPGAVDGDGDGRVVELGER